MRVLILAILLGFIGTFFIASQPALGQTQVQQAIRIVSPKAGDKLVNNFVDVTYEVASPASAASTPTFRLRLDNRDPVTTTDLSHTFTNLTAGAHTVTVELVDANGTPVPGSLSQIEFNVVVGQSSPNKLPTPRARVKDARGHYQPANWDPATDQDKLPQSGSALPLLSVIGLGVLIGGLASALKVTRQG